MFNHSECKSLFIVCFEISLFTAQSTVLLHVYNLVVRPKDKDSKKKKRLKEKVPDSLSFSCQNLFVDLELPGLPSTIS